MIPFRGISNKIVQCVNALPRFLFFQQVVIQEDQDSYCLKIKRKFNGDFVFFFLIFLMRYHKKLDDVRLLEKIDCVRLITKLKFDI